MISVTQNSQDHHVLADTDGLKPRMTSQSAEEEGPVKTKHTDLRYMHKPPRITPNYGKKTTSILPKSNISRVLLYDNVTQQQMLDVKLNHLRNEQQKTGRLLDLHRKSFLLRRLMKHQHVQEHKTVTSGVLDYLLPMLLDGERRGGQSSSPRTKKTRSFEGQYSASAGEFRLPDITEERIGRVHMRRESSGGVTRMIHTIPSGVDRESSRGSVRAKGKRQTVTDKRFQGLERLLVHLDSPGNGYIELSPSYHT